MLSPPAGSDFYYALRFSKVPPEPATALWSFFQALKAAQPPHVDETIAPVKLKWWEEELQKTFVEIPEHPITRALLPLIQTQHLSQSDFQQTLQAHIRELEPPDFETWDSLRHFAEQKLGSEISLYAQLFGHPNVIPSAFSRNLGIALFLIDKITYFGQDLAAGKLIWPQSDLDFFGITPSQLFNQQCPPGNISSLLLRQANRARQHYQTALAALPIVDRYSQLPLLILANLQLTLLSEIESENFAVLRHTYQLTPLRKCWIAWRTYRIEKRRRKHGNRRIKR